MVRPARPADIAALTDIYNHYIRTSVATFHLELLDSEHGRAWFTEFDDDDNPLLVFEDRGRVLGFAHYRLYRVKPGYRFTRESAVYVAEDAHGHGVGSALYEALIDRARQNDIHVLVAVIAGDNPASEALHRKFGFEHVGTYHEVGRKFDRWVDTKHFERIL